MFSPSVRLLLAAIAASLGLVQYSYGAGAGLVPFTAAALLALGYFRAATVWLGFRAYRRGDAAGVARRVRQVRYPHLLSARNRAYFEILAGVAALGRGEPHAALRHYAAAAAGPLRTPRMRVLVVCHLAEAAAAAGDPGLARAYVEEARRLPHDADVARLLDVLEAGLPPR